MAIVGHKSIHPPQPVHFSASMVIIACLAGCKKGEKTPGDETTDPVATTAPKTETDKVAKSSDALTKEDYIKAAIELGCLAQKEQNAQAISSKTMEILKKYKMDSTSWAAAAQKYGTDTSVAMEVSKGMIKCINKQ